MAKVLITGAAGFIGANTARYYLNKGYEVVAFDNLSRTGAIENLEWLKQNTGSGRLKLVVGDVRNPPAGLRAEVESSDVLFHFAGQVAVTTSVTDPRSDFEINALGTLNLLELVRTSQGKRPAFFYASTNKVYGGMEDVATVEGEHQYRYRDYPQGMTEDRLLDFHSPYGCSKGAADQYVRDYSRIYGLRSVVFRQSCIYGYRQFGVEDQGWVAWFIIAATLGRKITVYGDGKQVRDVLFIDDLVAAFDQAWNRIDEVAGRVYNIGGGPQNVLSLLDLLEALSKRAGKKIPVTFADWRPGDQPVYVSNISRAEREFSWTPAVGWEAGVDRLMRWVEQNKALLATLL